MAHQLRIALVVAAASLAAVRADAHHSSAAYDMTASASVSGTVRSLSWRNPHVLIELDVVGSDGKVSQWTLETTAPTSLAAAGWSRDLLATGTPITAEIRPTRHGETAGILRWVTLANGTVLPIDKDSPRSAAADTAAPDAAPAAEVPAKSVAELAAESRQAWLDRRKDADARNRLSLPESLPLVGPGNQPGAFDPDNVAKLAASKPAFDVTGVWQFRREEKRHEELKSPVWDFMPLPTLKPQTRTFYEETMAARAAGTNASDPTALCYPAGMPRLMTRIGNFLLVQRPTAIYLVHRFNNSFRTIFLDGRQHVPAAIRQDSYNGDSVGVWDKDSLFVDTVGFGQPNQFVQAGIPMSADARVTERWRVINDGNTIEIEYTITDPANWEGEWIDTKFYDRMLGADIVEANCIAAEDSVIPGAINEATRDGKAASPASEDGGGSGGGRLLALLFGGVLGAAGAWLLARRRRGAG